MKRLQRERALCLTVWIGHEKPNSRGSVCGGGTRCSTCVRDTTHGGRRRSYGLSSRRTCCTARQGPAHDRMGKELHLGCFATQHAVYMAGTGAASGSSRMREAPLLFRKWWIFDKLLRRNSLPLKGRHVWLCTREARIAFPLDKIVRFQSGSYMVPSGGGACWISMEKPDGGHSHLDTIETVGGIAASIVLDNPRLLIRQIWQRLYLWTLQHRRDNTFVWGDELGVWTGSTSCP